MNDRIREDIPVVIREMPKEEALALGAMALFGEKYGDLVRVVTIDPALSVELCGGTHVGRTGEIGLMSITGESAVAAGVRRVEALCGEAAQKHIEEVRDLLERVKGLLRTTSDPVRAIESLQAENAELKRHVEHLEARFLVGVRNEILRQDEIVNGITFIGTQVQVSQPDALKKLCFDLRNQLNDHLVVLSTNINGKPHVAVGISDTVVAAKGLDAGRIVKEHIAPLIKGGGGGQKNLATAGGQDASRLSEIPARVRALLL